MDLDELLHEVRRIEKSRVVLTEKKIKKLYLSLWKKINGFLSDSWVKYSDDDGRLTVQQLKNAGKYAKLLEEIVKNVDTLSESEKMLVMGAVEDTYKKTYKGMADAVKKADFKGNLKEVVKDINITPGVIKRAFDNNISKLTLTPIFQKNRAEIIYNIQQALNVGLMNGDRYDTVAKRIQEKVNFGYDKAIRVVRTETHRNIESGFNDCAVNISEGLQGSGFVYAATWRTMKDERVRPQVRYYTAKRGWITKRPSNAKANHQAMEGQIIQVGEMFDLGNDVTAPCPGMSGTANNDCNCRCFVEYEMMTEEEFNNKIKNYIENSQKSGILRINLSFFGAKSLKDATKYEKQLAEKCPLDMPKDKSKIKVSSGDKPTYKQRIYEWVDRDRKGKETEYKARWHERTPNAPKDNGETWVITRENKTTKKIEYYCDNGEWISKVKVDNAIKIRKNKSQYTESEVQNANELLDSIHLKNKELGV